MQNVHFTSIAGAIALLCPLLAAPSLAQVNAPSRGVICDQRGQVCYDNQGLSLGLTQQYFGAQAAQKVMNQIQNGRPPQEFRLSNGAACSTQARTCWSDGWNRGVVDWNLTTQLYNRYPGPGGSNRPTPGLPRPDQASGLCSLNRWGRQIFRGSCQLRKLVRGANTRFEAALANGQTFTFVARQGNFFIQDYKGGTWPVRFEHRGTTGIFRWSDLQLVATRTSTINSGGRPGDAFGNAAGAAIGAGLNAFINSLFQ